ncbi:pimeloyl-ACP methyl ester carboxylesterase [Litorivivens lipolytica]|uniref:Pimeloyl-ACP methyl ester carboxylesterase n=1 Tax=Litorivivens lipolytica TaxID=1524264 RepID=A0A7W4W6P0_9GAMM|nr:alpha/beta hydrolase [Litorivivens lipolytica]MBB3047909.1 pimeloyl-ACP methyl ester carboxylesterase [Litorivivens lipolytica]
MPVVRIVKALLVLPAVVILSACNDSSSSDSPEPVTASSVPVVTAPPPTLQCDESERLPRDEEVRVVKVTNNLRNVYDTDNYDFDLLEIDSTTFEVSIALPERCPGDRFPVVIDSHGYGGELSGEIDEDGVVDETAHFPQIRDLFRTLPHFGYVAVSFNQRGHGESQPDNGGGLARVMDPQAETQDAIRLLDWLAENAATYSIYTEDDTGIANDFRVGLIGYSYGGGWQFALAQLDKRVDTIVPVGTWHSLINSLLPGDAVKLSFDGLLCLFAEGTGGPDNPDVTNTPAVEDMCDLIGYRSAEANFIRTKDDLMSRLENDHGYKRDVVLQMFNRHMRHFQNQNGKGPWCDTDRPGCTDTSTFVARNVPTLLIQGNRDVLFNMTEAYWNYKFLSSLGDQKVAVLTNEGGHMNPLDNLYEGDSHCGDVDGLEVIRKWFAYYLKGESSEDYENLSTVCISVADTDDAHKAQAQGLLLDDFPKGSQSVATGGVPTRLESGSISIGAGSGGTDVATPAFLEVFTVPESAGDNYVLAGIPSIDEITVQNVEGNPNTAIAFFGVGIQRGVRNILVDAEVTGLVENPDSGVPYTGNPNVVGTDSFLLPGVGERLQPGDRVGLLFYQRHVQFSAVISGSSATGGTTLVQTAGGEQLPVDPVASAVNAANPDINEPNPYTVQVRGIELPIFDLRLLPANALSQGPEPAN